MDYEKEVQKIYATDQFRSFDDKRNTFGVVPSSEEEAVGVWVAKVLLLFQISVRRSVGSQEYTICSIWR